MNEQIQERLEALREEFSRGQEMLHQAEAEAAELRNSLLRISGAIQVLEELQEEESS